MTQPLDLKSKSSEHIQDIQHCHITESHINFISWVFQWYQDSYQNALTIRLESISIQVLKLEEIFQSIMEQERSLDKPLLSETMLKSFKGLLWELYLLKRYFKTKSGIRVSKME